MPLTADVRKMREFLAKLRAGIEPPPPRTDANRDILQAARQEVQRERGQEQAVPSAAPPAARPEPQEEPLIQAAAPEALGAAEAEPEAERGTGPRALTPPAPEVSGAPVRPQKRPRESSALVPAGSAPAVSAGAGVSPEYFAQWWQAWLMREAASRACKAELAEIALARARQEAEDEAAAEGELGHQCRKCRRCCQNFGYGTVGTSEPQMCTTHSEAFTRLVERRRAADP